MQVIRTFIYPSQKADYLHRLANYFSFVLSSAVLGSVLLPRSDYLMVESPPLFLGLSGFWLSRLKKARMIFNVSDLWPESAVRLGVLRRGGIAYKLSAALEAFCYREAWLVTGQARSILASIEARFPELSTYHLSNGVDTTRFQTGRHLGVHAELAADRGLIVLYAGLHGLAQGLSQVLDAARQLQHKIRIRFLLIGDGPEKAALLNKARELELHNVSFLDPIPVSEVPKQLAEADIVLVPLKTFIPGAVPSKLYEAMAAERPVVLVAAGEAAEIVLEHNAGIVVEPEDITGLIRALCTLHKDPHLRHELGRNGRRAAESCFDRAKIVAAFSEYLTSNLKR